jgi:hypothetical protein
MSNTAPVPDIQTTLEKALIDSIDGIKKTGTELIDALYQQAPEVIEQLLLWHAVESLAKFVTGILMVFGVPFATYKIIRKLYTHFKVEEWRDHETVNFWAPCAVIGIISNLTCILSGIMGFINIKWLKIWLAPKVYLLEYLSNFVK